MGRPGEINCSACCSAQAGHIWWQHAHAPRFLFIDVNLACNLRCAHCFFWKRDEATERYLTLPQRVELIEEYAGLARGRLVICGGEPMLALDTYFGVAQAARARALVAFPWSMAPGSAAPRWQSGSVLEGPHESRSLDGHDRRCTTRRAALWDPLMRRLCGRSASSFAARDKWGTPDTKIIVGTGLVFGSNHTMIEAFYDFVLNDVAPTN